MKITPLSFKDVLIIEQEVFKDERGFFFESFNQRTFNKLIGREVKFVQDNHSRSKKNVIRGLHFQIEKPQIKLIKVISGSIFDVVVDIRKQSINFGKYISVELHAEDNKQLWIPEGFAHGFCVLSEIAEVQYKVSEFWDPKLEQSLLWSDTDLNINWPLSSNPIISSKDQKASLIKDL